MSYKLILKYLVLLLASVQVHAGSQIDFTPHGTQPGLNFSLEPSSNCQGCHKGGNVADDSINMPNRTWMGSMKAHATRDPLFWAALDVANNDLPGVGDFCLRCHTPDGWFRGNVKPTKASQSFIDGPNGCELTGNYILPESKLNDYGGVSCHYCHRIEPIGPGGEAGFLQNGDNWIDDVACESGGFGPCRNGPYNEQDYMDGGSTPPHAWEGSNHIQSSEFCGSCHDISSPEILQNGMLSIARKFWNDGVETDLPMPIERTYSEWKNSLFADLIYRDSMEVGLSDEFPLLLEGETCQSCHMPQSESEAARACIFDALDVDGNGRRKGNLRTHQFAGANTWIPQVIKTIYGDQLESINEGIKESLDLSTDYALNKLQNESALIEATLTNQTSDELNINVKVTNLSGHKLPTSYAEGRRMWLHIVAKDGANNAFWESGAYDENTGILTEDTQLKVYEALQGIWNPDPDGNSSTEDGNCEVSDENGDKMFHFVLNNCVAKDNRIPPLGFRAADNIEMKPVGIIYTPRPGHPGQVVNFDVTNYQIPVTGVTGPFVIEATLKYQTASKDYIDFLAREATVNNFATENEMCDRDWDIGPANQSRGAFMKELWEENGRSAPVDMVMDFLQVNE
ncbi:hypothetical protein [Marinicella marina]|uniref:hypothetical protein n=1 Tax=Marinicella marina TaxID=2996016 RepID=UPI0024BC855C|nr:hypothetical protein [Marinicella marina]MDJ1140432.1 hypothetical protein [Marinicella marina]